MYDELVKGIEAEHVDRYRHAIGLPSSNTILQQYGMWREALEALAEADTSGTAPPDL